MTFTRRIPADRLLDFDVQEGDTLRVVALNGSSFVVQVSRSADAPESRQGKASEWLRTARGSARLKAGETVDDARMEFYSAKYRLAE